MATGPLNFGISYIEPTSSPHHFLHQTDELHQAAAQLGNLLLHFGHMLLVDLHQRLEGVASMLDTAKTPITLWFRFHQCVKSQYFYLILLF